MDAGVRTSSTRPGSGGRSTFKAVPELKKRLLFSSKTQGTILELRASNTNLQDCLPGTTYLSENGSGPWAQQYANGRTFDDAPDLPADLQAWWVHMTSDPDYYREQQRLFCGADVQLDNSTATGGLRFESSLRASFNDAHKVPDILKRHNYTTKDGGRWAPGTASGSPCVRLIPGHASLWQSDHASDPLHGMFDAWTAYVVLDHVANESAAEAAWEIERMATAVAGFSDLPALVDPLPAFNRRKSGEILPNTGNVTRALNHSGVCGHGLRFDTFRGETMLAPADTDSWRALRDTDYVELQLELESFGFAHIGTDMLRGAVHYVAEKHSFDSAEHWLTGLQWDGVPRVETFLPVYFGAADTHYTRAVGHYAWTALAGRVLSPGVKADMVPVAVGTQGCGKSKSVNAIAPAVDYFMEVDLSRSDDDQARLMRGKLVIELAELNGLRTREAEHIKAFISRTHENWTPKYMENSVSYARRGVFFGTSNKDDFLADDTGNRRWLPFHCGKCDPDAIKRDRGQLWAEASVLFKLNGVMHRAAETLAAGELGQFAAHDDWDTTVLSWLQQSKFDSDVKNGNLPYLTSARVLWECFRFEPGQHTPILQKRVKSVLMRLGYTYTQRRIDGQNARVFDSPSLF